MSKPSVVHFPSGRHDALLDVPEHFDAAWNCLTSATEAGAEVAFITWLLVTGVRSPRRDIAVPPAAMPTAPACDEVRLVSK